MQGERAVPSLDARGLVEAVPALADVPRLEIETLLAVPSVHLSLAANPSHLEAEDPVVLGKARAKQYQPFPEIGDIGVGRNHRVAPSKIHSCGKG